jgi:hypothetical protein
MHVPQNLSAAVHPLVFETGVPEAKYAIYGSGFLVGYGHRVFFVTARHVLRPDSLYPVCIPAPSGHLLPLRDAYFTPEEAASEDWADMAVIEVALDKTGVFHNDARVINLDLVVGDWEASRDTAQFFVLGFPNESSWVDYEADEVHMGFVELAGTYAFQGAAAYLHELNIPHPPPALKDFGGFSGSPVFCLVKSVGAFDRLLLCGMAIQGGRKAGIVRFVDASVILDLLAVRCRV